MSHAAMLLLDLFVPACFTVAFQNSFALPLLLKYITKEWARELVTCPLCFGFHISWIWCLFSDVPLKYVFIQAMLSLLLGQVVSLIKAVDEAASLKAQKIRNDIEQYNQNSGS